MATRPRRSAALAPSPVRRQAVAAATQEQDAALDPVYAALLDSVRLRIAPLAVFGAYLLAMLWLPTFADVAISDDWTYTRSVEYLVNQGQFHILPVAAATQVFQLFWGSAFALVFGMSFGSLRLSTVLLILISGLALYRTCRALEIDRERSAVGTGLYLFNPVLFPISYTFMSDPHFLGLLTISTCGYVLGETEDDTRWTIAGSVVAALACLQRPHGALIPLGVASYLMLTRRLPVSRASLVALLRVGALPAATSALFYLVVSAGLPDQQGLFFDEIRTATPAETWLLIRRIGVLEAVYVGLFLLPLMLAAVGAVAGALDFRSRGRWLSFTAVTSLVVLGVGWFWGEGRRMPYIPHFLGRGGPGSGDLRAARPPLAGDGWFDLATVASAAAAIGFAALVIRAIDRRHTPDRTGIGVVVGILAWQVAGVVPQSFLFRNWIISLDRYLLPLLPLVVALALWCLQRSAIHRTVMWGALAAVSLFSVVGTRDALVFQESVWRLASSLNQAGVSVTQLDAGYAWDAYYLWEYGETYQIPPQTPDGTWWTDVYARPTNSTYVIAGAPLGGYDVLSVHRYPAMLHADPQYLYVLRRTGVLPGTVVWPPT